MGTGSSGLCVSTKITNDSDSMELDLKTRELEDRAASLEAQLREAEDKADVFKKEADEKDEKIDALVREVHKLKVRDYIG
ncbi:hypothetical protein JTE90_002950 [Oedothorax gibbosus]|uniref:Tropomyosin n=1 Tax=Oedothorax gibbosus TaxID=931172 RepID=A0AAV6UJ54_9ARAC|nr:hypothetical protein JTE90_002950 [Oedothorax gibbosus]